MTIKYIVLVESRHYDWIAYTTTLAKANKLLKDEENVYYIFKCNLKTKESLKLNFPLSCYYKCLSINEYKEDTFIKNDSYEHMIIVIDKDNYNVVIKNSE